MLRPCCQRPTAPTSTDADCPLRPARKARRSIECRPLQGEALRACFDRQRPPSASRQPDGGVGSLATPGTTRVVSAAQVVGPSHVTANGGGLDHFQRNSPESVSAHYKKGQRWPGGPGDSGGGLGPGRGRFHIGKVSFSARAHPPERRAARPKKLHVRTRTTTQPGVVDNTPQGIKKAEAKHKTKPASQREKKELGNKTRAEKTTP